MLVVGNTYFFHENLVQLRLVPSSERRALGSHYGKIHHPHNIVLSIAIIGVLKGIQMSIYPGKVVLTCLLSNVVKKVGVRDCISW